MTTRKLTTALAGVTVAVAATVCTVLAINRYRNGEYFKFIRDEKVVEQQLKAEEARTAELQDAYNKAKAKYDAELAGITTLEAAQDNIVKENPDTFKDRKDYQRRQAEIDKLNKEIAPDKAKYEKAEAALKAHDMLIESYKAEQAEFKKAEEAKKKVEDAKKKVEDAKKKAEDAKKGKGETDGETGE